MHPGRMLTKSLIRYKLYRFLTIYILDERTQIIRIEEEGQKERCEQIVFHKETKVQDVINGLSMMKRDSAIIYESKGTSKICQNSDKFLFNGKIECDFD